MKPLPRLVVRVRFWLWDGQYEWLNWRQDWAERRLGSRIVDGICSVQARAIEWPGLWLICALFGHRPESTCGDPEHDCCITCQKSMPHTAFLAAVDEVITRWRPALDALAASDDSDPSRAGDPS